MPAMPDIIDWPAALRPAVVEWSLITPQRLGRSVLDGTVQAAPLGPPRWAFTVTAGVLRRAEGPLWEAFIFSLRGMKNRARVWDWRREAPLGPAPGTPVLAAAASGTSCLIGGWTPSTFIMGRGSWLGINGELKQLTNDLTSNGSGQTTATFEPPMRATAPSGTPVVLVKPTSLFVMTTDRAGFSQEGGRAPRGNTFTFEESFG